MFAAMFELALFDLDGTLCDTVCDIAANANRVLKRYGQKELSEQTVRGYVGSGVRVLMQRCFKGTDVNLEEAVNEFMKTYGEHLVEHTRVYPGVDEGLARLSRVRKVIVSNKPEDLSRRLVERLGLTRHFERVVGGDTFPSRKPDPMPVLEILGQFSASRNASVMVGDSEIDLETAQAAGVKCCLVAYGYSDRGMLQGADFVAENFESVVAYVRGEIA